jgi:hypothetical protein
MMSSGSGVITGGAMGCGAREGKLLAGDIGRCSIIAPNITFSVMKLPTACNW